MSAMSGPIVVKGAEVAPESLRKNPRIIATRFFSNFAAGHLVGASVAYHPRSEECGRHRHRGAVELFIVMAGSGKIEVGDETHEVSAGDCVVVPQGVYHNLIGVSGTVPFTVACAFVVAPGHENDKTPWAAE